MPETPEQLHARAAGALGTPPVHEWDSWPFEGEIRPKALAPLTPEPALHGHGGTDCRACATPDSESLWSASFAEIWDGVLPPTPHATWQDNLDRVGPALGAGT